MNPERGAPLLATPRARVLTAMLAAATLLLAACGGASHGTPSSGAQVASKITAPTRSKLSHTRSDRCFSAPGACGYPDPADGVTGASSPCASLASSPSITVSSDGEHVSGKNILGTVTITASDVTLENDCVTLDGAAQLGSKAIFIASGATGTKIDHTTVSGEDAGAHSVDEALSNNYGNANTSADHDRLYNCGECVHGPWTLTNSYVDANATIASDHYEDIYCNSTTFVAEHDTLLNPHEQTAVLFCDTANGSGGPASNHITLTDSLLAGGGYPLYPQGNSSSVGTSTMTVSDSRFARCATAPVFEKSSGGTACRGGSDSSGYWPGGGYFGVDADKYCPPIPGQKWTGNVWDDTGATVSC